MIKVSVVIPIYNMERFLEQCLDSARAQTLRDIEIICVDDGSTDSTPSILRRYEREDSRVRVITQKNSFAGVARNSGMDVATGEYLSFMDPDDFYDENMLELMYQQAKKTDADLCVCGGRYYHNDTGEYTPWNCLETHMLPRKEVFRARELGSDAFRFAYPGPTNKLIRRSLAMRRGLRFLNTRHINDMSFINLCIALSERITVYSERPLAVYRVGLTSNSQSNVQKAPLDFALACQALREGLIRENSLAPLRRAYDDLMAVELERYATRFSAYPEAFSQLDAWVRQGGAEVFDIHPQNVSASTLCTLLATFDGVQAGMTGDEILRRVRENRDKHRALYHAGLGKRSAFLLDRLIRRLGFLRGAPIWALLIGRETLKKLTNR